MYSLANIPTVFIYAISLTNAIDSFIVNQLHGPSINRWVLSVLCVELIDNEAVDGVGQRDGVDEH